MALGRMARDSELIAFAACGLGPVQTYRSLFYAAIPIAILTAWFSFYVRPIVVGDLQELRERQKDQAYQISGLKAGRFYQQGDGKITVYVEVFIESPAHEKEFVALVGKLPEVQECHFVTG